MSVLWNLIYLYRKCYVFLFLVKLDIYLIKCVSRSLNFCAWCMYWPSYHRFHSFSFVSINDLIYVRSNYICNTFSTLGGVFLICIMCVYGFHFIFFIPITAYFQYGFYSNQCPVLEIFYLTCVLETSPLIVAVAHTKNILKTFGRKFLSFCVCVCVYVILLFYFRTTRRFGFHVCEIFF